jgi:hypothetical protein
LGSLNGSSSRTTMTKSYMSGEQLARAFPLAIRADVQVATFGFPVTRLLGEDFSLRVGDEMVVLPHRIHNDPALIHLDHLTDLQRELIACLLTRHTDGFVREHHLARIIHSRNVWIPPFVVQLVGEYVIEILQVIKQNLRNLDTFTYGKFLRANPDLLATTETRYQLLELLLQRAQTQRIRRLPVVGIFQVPYEEL